VFLFLAELDQTQDIPGWFATWSVCKASSL
jgi:hypothetical protein